MTTGLGSTGPTDAMDGDKYDGHCRNQCHFCIPNHSLFMFSLITLQLISHCFSFSFAQVILLDSNKNQSILVQSQ